MSDGLKAYRIVTTADEGFAIYVAESAGKAKTTLLYAMWDAYSKADYSWIKSCRRAPEFDYLAAQAKRGCVAWSHDGERWQADRGHWWRGDDVAPVTAQAEQVTQ